MSARGSVWNGGWILLLLVTLIGSPALAQESATGAVRGIVYDSTSLAPLIGATVTVVGTPRFAMTDADGVFRIYEVPAGEHRISLFHPRLDELGLGGRSWVGEIVPGETTEIALSIPSARTLAQVLCRDQPGVLLGVLREEPDGGAVRGGAVVVRWEEGARELVSSTQTDEDGRFVLCGLPRGRPLRVEGRTESRRGMARAIRIPSGGVLADDVTMDLSRSVRLRGRVRSGEGGAPVEGAEARVVGTSRSGVTARDGRFALDGIPPGRQVLEIEHLAFGIYRDTLHLEPGEVREIDITTDETAVELEGIDVEARRRRGIEGRLAGFYQRMETHHGGRFVTREELEPRDSQPLLMVLQSLIPNLRQRCVLRGTLPFCRLESSRRTLSLSGNSDGMCRPTVYVDGVRFEMPVWTNLEEIFTPAAIETVEFYPGAASIPVEFNSSNARCGVLVIWSRES